MYGYGLEGDGYGYRYPPIEGYYEEPIVLGTITRGRLAGKPIKKYPPKINQQWVAAYLLNKEYSANKWRDYARKALRDARNKYEEEVINPMKDSPDPNIQQVFKDYMENK
jgi:hypothetical protein